MIWFRAHFYLEKNLKSIPKVTLQNSIENMLNQKKIDKNPENACSFYWLTFYRKKFRAVFDMFTRSVRNNLEQSFSKLESIQKVFEIPAKKENYAIDLIKSIVDLPPEFFVEEPENIQVDFFLIYVKIVKKF